jgi:3-hydroxy-9,10-secoandrosta-1,3,5(10)-triene-9,17-dione monooxygenase reductase component
MSENQEILGAAIGCIPSGLFIITTTQAQKHGVMLASWVQQAGFEPPTVSIAVARERHISSMLTIGSPVVVNILEKGQGKLIGHFSKGFEPDSNPFAEIAIGTAPSGQPYLTEAIAYLDTTVTQIIDAGDHDLVLVQIKAGERLRDGEPAAHTRRNGFKY